MPLAIGRFLGQDCSSCKIRAICFNAKGFVVVWEDKDGGGGNALFELIKGFLLRRAPLPFDVLLGKVKQGPRMEGEVVNELPIEVGEAQKGLHLLLVCRRGPVSYTCHLDEIHPDLPFRYDQTKVFNLGPLKLAFFRLEEKLVLPKTFQNQARDATMFLKGFGEYQDVIQVHTNHSFGNQVLEDVVHHGLECGRTVRKAKEHHQRFVETSICLERSLPFIAFLHPHIVETPTNVKLGKVARAAQTIDELGDERMWIAIFD